MVQDHFWKDAFLTHFCPIVGPKTAHFQGILGFSMAQNASPRAQKGLKTLVWASQMVQGHFLEKRVFDQFLAEFLSQNGPFSRLFGIFHGPKRATTGSKRAKNACLSIPSGLGTTLEKMIFFDPGTLVDPPVAPSVRGPGCPPAPPSDGWYGGLGGSLGDSEGWKPQKLGGCGWTRCPRNSDWSHVAQDTARSWFWPCWTQITHV